MKPGMETKREWFADSPASFIDWIDKRRPEWNEQAKAHGYGHVDGFNEACEVWNAAIEAVMRHIHDTPIRELHDKVYELWIPPPMAGVASGQWLPCSWTVADQYAQIDLREMPASTAVTHCEVCGREFKVGDEVRGDTWPNDGAFKWRHVGCAIPEQDGKGE
jgi:glutathionylspermidine synthase